MKNSLLKIIYHFFLVKYHKIKSFRGGWMLSHIFYNEYKNRKTPLINLIKIHLKGWSYTDWSTCGINDDNRKKYLSTRDYCSLHPLNGIYSGWIDDKLILKYILHGTDAGVYMPDYYYQFTETGEIIPLMDLKSSITTHTYNDVLDLIKSKRALALKPIKSSLGIGFYKVEYTDGFFFMNGEKMDKNTFLQKIKSLKNYIATEYLLPHAEFAKFSSSCVGSVRYILARNSTNELINIYSAMRVGTKRSHYVDNYDAGGVLHIVNDGKYDYGNVYDFENNKNQTIQNHPDNSIRLKGEVPLWHDIVIASQKIAQAIPQLKYMGIDFCVTNENKVKVIEINSLPAFKFVQVDKTVFEKGLSGDFFRERLCN